ncbi:unnamed protein product [Amoebophrya sp. A25]|nr:unnamed protein product [Amoebophrya sp. A25]|eukprot:GSA25T00006874001.1
MEQVSCNPPSPFTSSVEPATKEPPSATGTPSKMAHPSPAGNPFADDAPPASSEEESRGLVEGTTANGEVVVGGLVGKEETTKEIKTQAAVEQANGGTIEKAKNGGVNTTTTAPPATSATSGTSKQPAKTTSQEIDKTSINKPGAITSGVTTSTAPAPARTNAASSTNSASQQAQMEQMMQGMMMMQAQMMQAQMMSQIYEERIRGCFLLLWLKSL